MKPASRSNSTRSPSPPRSRWPWALALAAIALLVLGWGLRGPLGDRLWPEAEADTLRRQADVALARGHLTANDGSGARELYEAALAIDPDRGESRAGLARVAEAALRQAMAATERGAFAEAHRHLQLARALSAPRARVDAATETLRQREAEVAGIDALLREADAARAAGRLDGDPQAALPLYRRILALQPQHLRALEGREDALEALLARARTALGREDTATAAALIAAARDYDPGHGDLPDVQAQLVRLGEDLRQRGDRALRAGRLDRASAAYRRWLDGGAEPAAARQALEDVARAHVLRARRSLEAGRPDLARAELLAADGLSPSLPESREARQALRRIERAGNHAATLSPSVRRDRLRKLLETAEQAEARGDWLTPPGESAFDALRAARSLAPDDPQVRRASSRMRTRAHDCYERELRDNRLQRARNCLDAWAALDGDRRALVDARGDLARRWIAVGEERLGRGELPGARAAHDTARALDRRVDGLADFDARLRAAEAVVR